MNFHQLLLKWNIVDSITVLDGDHEVRTSFLEAPHLHVDRSAGAVILRLVRIIRCSTGDDLINQRFSTDQVWLQPGSSVAMRENPCEVIHDDRAVRVQLVRQRPFCFRFSSFAFTVQLVPQVEVQVGIVAFQCRQYAMSAIAFGRIVARRLHEIDKGRQGLDIAIIPFQCIDHAIEFEPFAVGSLWQCEELVVPLQIAI